MMLRRAFMGRLGGLAVATLLLGSEIITSPVLETVEPIPLTAEMAERSFWNSFHELPDPFDGLVYVEPGQIHPLGEYSS